MKEVPYLNKISIFDVKIAGEEKKMTKTCYKQGWIPVQNGKI